MELHDKVPGIDDDEQVLSEPPRCGLLELARANAYDPVIEAYKKDIDRTLLIENLRISPKQGSEELQGFTKCLHIGRKAGEKMRQKEAS